jgi:NAD(P)-dependent dehydrogenase (short-subunit alcohol dehydrogenase family)
MRGLRDKGVLISGGTSGIGLATAGRFLQEGSRVFVGGVEKAEVEAALETLRDAGSVAGIQCDVSEEDGAAALVDAAAAALGRVDVLINNAGIARKVRFLDLEPDEWDRMIAVNLRGMFLVARLVAGRMIADRGAGSIVLMASTNALGGEEEFAHYNASKGGVLQLMRSMAVELGRHGVRVNCLCPGFIDTPLNRGMADEAQFHAYAERAIPLGRYGRAEEVAAAYAFLASEEASFIHGSALVVDGGQTAVM